MFTSRPISSCLYFLSPFLYKSLLLRNRNLIPVEQSGLIKSKDEIIFLVFEILHRPEQELF
jgi:hypothetical protein